MHLIDKGHVAVRLTTPAGEVATLRILGPGDLFGELAVLDPGPRMATTVALDAVETLSLHRTVVDQLRADHTSVDRVLLTASQREVRRLSAALSEVLYTSVPTRSHGIWCASRRSSQAMCCRSPRTIWPACAAPLARPPTRCCKSCKPQGSSCSAAAR